MNELTIVSVLCTALGGQAEVTLSDNTRADCVTATHAYEVDYGDHWAEAVGQSLHYAHITGLEPGIILIDATQAQRERLQGVIYRWNLPIRVRHTW